MQLIISPEQYADRRVLVLSGDLDLDSAGSLMASAQAMINDHETDIVLDAGQLEFCDSAGLSAFVRIANQLSQTGGRLAIAQPTEAVSRVLAITGLVEAFVVTESVAQAVEILDKGV